MSTVVLTTRVTPHIHDQLRELAERRGASLAATAADLLTASLEQDHGSQAAQDGSLVAAVRTLVQDVADPEAVIYRELAIHLARTIERRAPGWTSAVKPLRDSISQARHTQRLADRPKSSGANDPLDDLLAGLM
jgi:hypothetical protein